MRRWLRHPHTTAEKRANCAENRQYVRGKRLPAMLPSVNDDIPISKQRNWKKYRKKQYHCNGRGKEHQLVFPPREKGFWRWWCDSDERRLQFYLEDHDIPHCVIHLEYGDKIVWWYDKDIGVSHILRKQ